MINLNQPSILYMDMSNLYGWALSEPLPHGLFRFLDEGEMEQFNLQNISKDSKKGYILEVDLEYPRELHDSHNCYPLAPLHKKIQKEELSPYSQRLWKELNGENQGVITEKLILTLANKEHYILHYRNLQLYVELGMSVKKIHRILEFDQSPWLRGYIEFNSSRRKECLDDFHKDFYKLMNNSVFGE